MLPSVATKAGTPKRAISVPLMVVDGSADCDGGKDGDHGMRGIAARDEAPGDNAGNCEDRADGQLDAAGQDHEGHADGEDAVDRDLTQDIRQIARRQKIRMGEGEDHEKDQEGDQDAVARQKPAEGSATALAAAAWEAVRSDMAFPEVS